MAYENKPGDGAMFTNKNKTSDKQPHYTGKFIGLDGVEYQIAAWEKSNDNVGSFFSLKISPKYEGGR